MHGLTWDDVRVFLAARDAGSLSRAARVLRVRQSTVSRRMAAMETSVGGALFHRTARGLVLTERGEALVDAAERMAEAARDLELAASGRDEGVDGVVRVAIAEGLAAWGLVPRLGLLRRAHPGLRVQLVVSAGIADLSRREADLALRFVRPTGGHLVARRLMDFPLGVLVHRDLAEVPWEKLPWVTYAKPGIVTPLDAWHAEHVPAPVLTTDGYGAVVAAVQHGLGAGLLSAGLAAQLDGVVVRASPVALPAPMPLWLVAHRAVRSLRRVDVVWKALEEMVWQMRDELPVSAPVEAAPARGPTRS